MRSTIATIILLALATSVSAQTGGTLALYSDPSASSCQLFAQEGGLLEVYVVHENATAVSGASFRVSVPYCAPDIWGLNGEAITGTADGWSQSGVLVQYGSCMASPIVVMKLTFYLSGEVPPCCPLTVEESGEPTHQGLSAIGCGPGFEVLSVSTQPGYMNPTPSCTCAVSTETTTWGKIKATYR